MTNSVLSANPKDPRSMSAAEINKSLDRLDKEDSKLTNAFIDAGRGNERPSEYLSANATDALSTKAKELYRERMGLVHEVERRAGPGMRRLPRGFGPIKMNPRTKGPFSTAREGVDAITGTIYKPVDYVTGKVVEMGDRVSGVVGKAFRNPSCTLRIGTRKKSFGSFEEAHRAGVNAAHTGVHAEFEIDDGERVVVFDRKGREKNPSQSLVGKIDAFISGLHVMGDDPLRDYHTARRIRDALRTKSYGERFLKVRSELKNYRAMVSMQGDEEIRIHVPGKGDLILGGSKQNPSGSARRTFDSEKSAWSFYRSIAEKSKGSKPRFEGGLWIVEWEPGNQNPSAKQILVYGIPKGGTERYEEVLLAESCTTKECVERVKALASKDGFHSFRVTTWDGSPPNFAKAVNPAVSGPQYRMAQAVLSGQSKGMPVRVARELVDTTPGEERSEFMRENPGHTITLSDGRVFPVYNGEPLSWDPGSYHTHNEEKLGYPKARAVIRAMKEERPEQLEKLHRELVKDSFGKMFGHNAKKLLDVLEQEVGKQNPAFSTYQIRGSGYMKRGWYYMDSESTVHGPFTSRKVAEEAAARDKEAGERKLAEREREMRQNPHWEVIESRLWRHLPSGRSASIYGALPWRSPSEKQEWEMQTTGWTVKDAKSGTVGIGRMPWKTREEAEEWVREHSGKRNPEPEAAAMYESFHGTPSTEVVEVREEEHYHGNMAELGVLVSMEVETVTGLKATLGFSADGHGEKENASPKHHPSSRGGWVIRGENEYDEDGKYLYWSNADGWVNKNSADVFSDEEKKKSRLPVGGVWERRGFRRNPADPTSADTVLLCANETGTHLYLIGGDQSLDLSALKFDKDEWTKDMMVIGDITTITYRTAKEFDKFEEIDYFHHFSEDTKGPLPELVYDTMNEKLLIVGGQYFINQPAIGMSPGIEN